MHRTPVSAQTPRPEGTSCHYLDPSELSLWVLPSQMCLWPEATPDWPSLVQRNSSMCLYGSEISKECGWEESRTLAGKLTQGDGTQKRQDAGPSTHSEALAGTMGA